MNNSLSILFDKFNFYTGNSVDIKAYKTYPSEPTNQCRLSKLENMPDRVYQDNIISWGKAKMPGSYPGNCSQITNPNVNDYSNYKTGGLPGSYPGLIPIQQPIPHIQSNTKDSRRKCTKLNEYSFRNSSYGKYWFFLLFFRNITSNHLLLFIFDGLSHYLLFTGSVY